MIRRTARFAASLKLFKEIREFVEGFADAAGMSPEACHKLTLIVEELFTNTVRHGHQGDSEELVDLVLAKDAERVTISYLDSAPRYDSLAAAMRTDIESTIRQQRIGGLGLALTFAMAETAQYAYLDGRNRIILTLRPAP